MYYTSYLTFSILVYLFYNEALNFLNRMCVYFEFGWNVLETRAVLRLVWPFDGIVQKHIHK